MPFVFQYVVSVQRPSYIFSFFLFFLYCYVLAICAQYVCVCATIFNMSQLSAKLALSVHPHKTPSTDVTQLGLASERLETNAELMLWHIRRHRRCRQ